MHVNTVLWLLNRWRRWGCRSRHAKDLRTNRQFSTVVWTTRDVPAAVQRDNPRRQNGPRLLQGIDLRGFVDRLLWDWLWTCSVVSSTIEWMKWWLKIQSLKATMHRTHSYYLIISSAKPWKPLNNESLYYFIHIPQVVIYLRFELTLGRFGCLYYLYILSRISYAIIMIIRSTDVCSALSINNCDYASSVFVSLNETYGIKLCWI